MTWYNRKFSREYYYVLIAIHSHSSMIGAAIVAGGIFSCCKEPNCDAICKGRVLLDRLGLNQCLLVGKPVISHLHHAENESDRTS